MSSQGKYLADCGNSRVPIPTFGDVSFPLLLLLLVSLDRRLLVWFLGWKRCGELDDNGPLIVTLRLTDAVVTLLVSDRLNDTERRSLVISVFDLLTLSAAVVGDGLLETAMRIRDLDLSLLACFVCLPVLLINGRFHHLTGTSTEAVCSLTLLL